MPASSRRAQVVLMTAALLTALLALSAAHAGAGDPPGAVTIGPQAMEGDLKVAPGTQLLAGYDFTIPGRHPETTVAVGGAAVTFEATCVNGAGAGTIVIPLPDATYVDAQDSSGWYPSGDQHSPAVYQGATIVPDLCSGGLVRLQQGGLFAATVTASDTSHKINLRWHYSADGTSGSWSGTRSVVPGSISSGGGE